MPSIRYTVRLPPALDAAVQERIRTAGTPFAVLIRDALSAYLADTTPTGLPTPADSANTFRELQEKLADVTTRVKVIEEMLTTWPQFADPTVSKPTGIKVTLDANDAKGAHAHASSAIVVTPKATQ
jgi:hypothetical protein